MDKISVKLRRQNSLLYMGDTIEIELVNGSEEERRKVFELIGIAVMSQWSPECDEEEAEEEEKEEEEVVG